MDGTSLILITDVRPGWVRGCGGGRSGFSGFLASELPLSVLAVCVSTSGALVPLRGQMLKARPQSCVCWSPSPEPCLSSSI